MTPNITLMVAQAHQEELLRAAEASRAAAHVARRPSLFARLARALPRRRFAHRPAPAVRPSVAR